MSFLNCLYTYIAYIQYNIIIIVVGRLEVYKSAERRMYLLSWYYYRSTNTAEGDAAIHILLLDNDDTFLHHYGDW